LRSLYILETNFSIELKYKNVEQRTPANRRQSLTRSQRGRRCAGVPTLSPTKKSKE
jgi:hypothetical protein